MAYYLVKAKIIKEKFNELEKKLFFGEIASLRPFGKAMDYSLRNARYDFDGYLVWEEEDYCSPPLAMEREAVLDHYFYDLNITRVKENEGWKNINHFPNIWLIYQGLPFRTGERPLTRKGTPHQQLDQNPDLSIYKKLHELLFSIPDVIEMDSLISVPGARALWLNSEDSSLEDAFMIGREFAHLHPPYDGSLHIMAPPNWVDEIISKGWGEKHPLAGEFFDNALMIYAPRNEEEIKIVYNIVLLSYWRAKGKRIPAPGELFKI